MRNRSWTGLMVIYIFIFIFILLYPLYSHAASVKIMIPCEKGKEAIAVVNDGKTYDLGKVLSLPEKTQWPAYTASVWGEESTVCASAVNAIHLLVSREKGRGRTVSIVPADTVAPAAGQGNFFLIDSKPGYGLFGAFAPPVGAEARLVEPGSEIKKLLTSLKTSPECRTLIITYETDSSGYVIDVENRPGGRIIFWDDNGAHLLARVIRPVRGVGRFEGTAFQREGRIRANHPGVIDISTSPYGYIGGFQIIPLFHAFSSEMKFAWQLSQWMIITDPYGKNTLEGKAPLFSGTLIPGPQEGEYLWDMWSSYGRRSLVLVRKNGGKWERMPSVISRNDSGLDMITHFKIYLPVNKVPLE